MAAMINAAPVEGRAQSIDEVLRDYDRGRLDRAREALETLEDRYYDRPEYLFLRAVFEEDAEQAFALYQQINETAPDNPIFHRVLWRMCQYNYAKGLYKAGNDMIARFLENFPDSEYTAAAKQMQYRIADKLGEELPETEREKEQPKTVYTIQIAAFGSRNGAERGLDYYRRLGIAGAEIQEHRVGRQMLYKIWIGEYTDREEARRRAEELQRRYRLSDFTIVEKSR
ncbi:SPOR domain-containing protein [candidate division KSB1 bacterium]